jgi:hypothetical protein
MPSKATITRRQAAAAILRNPANRAQHLGASIFLAEADIVGFFADHPACLDQLSEICEGYKAAGICRA